MIFSYFYSIIPNFFSLLKLILNDSIKAVKEIKLTNRLSGRKKVYYSNQQT